MVHRGKGYEALSFAIRKNSLSLAKKILHKPNALVIDEEWTDYILLIKALQRGRTRIASLLLKNDCRVNRKDKTNFFHTPLYYAVRLGNISLIKLLLSRGALINGRDSNEDTPFCLALKNKSYRIIDVLLHEYLYQVDRVTNLNSDDCIAFNAACLRDNKFVIENFIKQGFSVNKYQNSEFKDETNCTPLHIAVRHQSLEAIKLLLKYGADFNAKNGIGQTPLHLAYYMIESRYPHKNCWKVADILLSEFKKLNMNTVDNQELSLFHVACASNRSDVVKHFLECNVDVNKSISFDAPICPGYTPLHFAIEKGHKEIIELLLKHGADVTIKNKAGETPFHFAFHFLYFSMYKNLVDYLDVMLTEYVPKNVNPINSNGLSHFHIACTSNNTTAIEAFLQNGVSINAPVNFDALKCPGFTPLHFAVSFNKKLAVEILLKYNADPNVKDKEGLIPLHLACQQNAKKIFKILQNSIPASISNEKLSLPSAFEKLPSKVLDLIARQTEQIEIVELLLQYKSNVDLKDNSGKTPLFHACDVDHDTFRMVFGKSMTYPLFMILKEFNLKREEIIKRLLQYNPNINVSDNESKTVLHYITETEKEFRDSERAKVAEILLQKGANVNATTKTGLTPLHIALNKSCQDLIDVLLKYDVDPNIAEYNELCTPLHIAASNDLLAPNNEKIISTLLEKGADIDLKQIDGKTALHIAASTRYSSGRLKALLEKDCDIDSQDKRGKTALHMACLNRNEDNVMQLLKYGADINITDRLDKTALFYYYEFEIDVLDTVSHMYKFNPIYYAFKNHIRRLCTIGYFIRWENINYYMKLKDLHKKRVSKVYEDDVLLECEKEVEIMKNIKLNNFCTLYDILFKDPNEMAVYTKNETFMKIIAEYNFPQYLFLFELQVKRGLARCELLQPAKNALEALLGLSLPDSCSERIFRYLSNKNLKDLIKTQTFTG